LIRRFGDGADERAAEKSAGSGRTTETRVTMARHYGREKIELRSLLEMIAGSVAGAGELVAQIMERFRCSERAAKDALAILKRAKLVEARPGRPDRRTRVYVLTRRGRAVLAHRYGPLLVRFARKLFTSCPSRRGRTRQAALIERGDLEAVFGQAEFLLLYSAEESERNHPILNPDPETMLPWVRPVVFPRGSGDQ
jgi:DNA-binding MarR family transcriptional regulator